MLCTLAKFEVQTFCRSKVIKKNVLGGGVVLPPQVLSKKKKTSSQSLSFQAIPYGEK